MKSSLNSRKQKNPFGKLLYECKNEKTSEMRGAAVIGFFMFSHPDGQPFHHERPYLWFRQFVKKNGFRYIRFHDLRHTSATILINQGVHAKIISELLGHGSLTTTINIYGHALRNADQAAADKFESFFTSKAAQGQ